MHDESATDSQLEGGDGEKKESSGSRKLMASQVNEKKEDREEGERANKEWEEREKYGSWTEIGSSLYDMSLSFRVIRSGETAG